MASPAVTTVCWKKKPGELQDVLSPKSVHQVLIYTIYRSDNLSEKRSSSRKIFQLSSSRKASSLKKFMTTQNSGQYKVVSRRGICFLRNIGHTGELSTLITCGHFNPLFEFQLPKRQEISNLTFKFFGVILCIQQNQINKFLFYERI